MEANEYLKILYTGIVDNSEYLESYIRREQLKAEANHVNKNEFISRLNKAIKTIINEFKNKESMLLAEHYRRMEKDRLAPEGYKYDYPKEIPTVYSFGLPLLKYTSGQYKGELTFVQVEAFFIALKNIVDSEVLEDEMKKQLENKFEIKIESTNSPSHLTTLMKQYISKGCKPLNNTQVIRLNNGKAIGGLINRWKVLIDDDYTFKPNANSIKPFIKTYTYLVNYFQQEKNEKAIKEVQNRLDTLNEEFPHLFD